MVLSSSVFSTGKKAVSLVLIFCMLIVPVFKVFAAEETKFRVVSAEGTMYLTGTTCNGNVRDQIQLNLTIVVDGSKITVRDQFGFTLTGKGKKAGFTVRANSTQNGTNLALTLRSGRIRKNNTSVMNLNLGTKSPSVSCTTDYKGVFNFSGN